jgi:hypothetical protein
MCGGMARYRKAPAVVWVGFLASLVASGAVWAAPPGVALVIGNATYTSLPPLSGCALSSRSVSAVLKGQGYDVVDRPDASTGQLDAAIGTLIEKLASVPGVPVVIYVCGYVAGLNDRPFLLSVSAALQRPSDVLTQGMLAKAFIDATTRSGARTALIVLDAIPVPGSAEPIALGTLDRPDLPSGLGLLAVTDTAGDAPTPLTIALVPRLKVTPVEMPALVDGVAQDLAGLRTATVSFRRSLPGAGYLVGAPAPLPAAPAAATLPEPAPAAVVALDESRMTETDRRTMQTALAKLGYYDGKIDGVFGADTRAAIRRLQHELQAPMTGQLTAEQTRRLTARQ